MRPRDCAVAVTARERAELVPMGERRALNADDIRGRTLCTAISPGTELAACFHGETFPCYPGYAAVFEVEEKGGDVTGFDGGDVAFCMGNHRSFQQVPVHQAVRVPPGLDPEYAVLARLMGVTMATLVTTRARSGDTVVVTGLGPVGHLGAKIFRACGYEVMACDPDETRLGFLAGNDVSLYPRVPVDDKGLEGCAALVLECSAQEQAVLDGCRLLRRNGELVLVGVPWKRTGEAYLHDLLSLVFHRYLVLRSGWEWQLPGQPSVHTAHSIFGNFATALEWLHKGRIDVQGLVRLMSPHAAQDVYTSLLRREGKALFVEFDWREIAS